MKNFSLLNQRVERVREAQGSAHVQLDKAPITAA